MNLRQRKIRSFLKIALAIGLLVVSSASFAATVTTTFTGTVPDTCSFSSNTSTVMKPHANAKVFDSDGLDITCTGEDNIERQTVVLPAGKTINLNSPQHFSLQHIKDGSVHIITTFIAN